MATLIDNGKPAARWGRKATGVTDRAGPPKSSLDIGDKGNTLKKHIEATYVRHFGLILTLIVVASFVGKKAKFAMAV